MSGRCPNLAIKDPSTSTSETKRCELASELCGNWKKKRVTNEQKPNSKSLQHGAVRRKNKYFVLIPMVFPIHYSVYHAYTYYCTKPHRIMGRRPVCWWNRILESEDWVQKGTNVHKHHCAREPPTTTTSSKRNQSRVEMIAIIFPADIWSLPPIHPPKLNPPNTN